MLTTLTRRPTSALVLATALALCGGTAQAQSAQQPSTTDDKGCQANTSGANGRANDADLDGTYSACSLVNGFIGFGARTNDGTSQAQEFGTGESDQVLRNPQFGNQDHRLTNLLAQQGDDSAGAGSRTGRSGGQYRFGARDFVAGQDQPPIDDAGGYRGAARTYADAGSAYAPLLFSSSSETGALDGQAGVGGGGSAGGIDSGGNAIGGGGGGAVVPPITPAVPEPETWAMLLAGLGLLAFAGRRKAARTA